MRTEKENALIHALAVAILARRGISETAATYEEASEAYEIACEAVVVRGKTTLADTLAVGAVDASAGDPDELTQGLLAKFATRGQFVCGLGIEEEEFLREAIRAEQKRDAEC